MTSQDALIQLVKQKGVGKTMSKSLTRLQLTSLTDLCCSNDVSSATIATLLTAFMMLDNTPEEQEWFNHTSTNYQELVHPDCHFLFQSSVEHHIQFFKHIKHVISKNNLTYSDTLFCLEQLLDPSIPAAFKTAFLEAERLKEESPDENKAFLSFAFERSIHTQLDLPLLIDLSNPYDGFNRYFNCSVLLAPFMAALGFPVILHGCEDVAPKKGITPFKLLNAAKKDPLKSIQEISECLLNPAIGWGYIDQSIFCSDIHQLRSLRTDLVKRPALATIEKMLLPFHATKTYMVTGYTHPPYRQKSIDLLNQIEQLDGYLIVRGMEGANQLPLDRRCPFIVNTHKPIKEGFVRPSNFDIPEIDRISPDGTISVDQTLDWQTLAFNDQTHLSFYQLLYQACAILTTLELSTTKHLMQLVQTKRFLTNFYNSWKNY